MGTFQRGRHSQAFILISLTDGPSYGLDLKNRIANLTGNSEIDLSFLYRTLNKLERDGYLTSYLDDTSQGPARKYYKLTKSGYTLLDEFEVDIRDRVKNLQSFLTKYEELKQDEDN
ncbi:MAG: PadR family transcriptional regulator [Pleomorphochaeta sp.]